MSRRIDFVYNSEMGKSTFQLASGYISETNILFEKEGVVAVIQAEGSVEFFDANDTLLAKSELPPVDDGKNKYQEVCCNSEAGSLVLQFPIYEWIDNYPNCDGEHDRWDTRTIGYKTIEFDCSSNAINTNEV